MVNGQSGDELGMMLSDGINEGIPYAVFCGNHVNRAHSKLFALFMN
jgi:hypothetical protein